MVTLNSIKTFLLINKNFNTIVCSVSLVGFFVHVDLCLCVRRLLDEKLRAPFARWSTGAVHYCQ